jgi:hypothetical protein
MRPTYEQPTQHRLFSRLVTRFWKPLVLCSLIVSAAAGYLLSNSGTLGEAKAVRAAPVESFDVGLKMGRYKVQLDRDTATTYRGEIGAAAAMQDGARPLSMASEDFDNDGMQDLAVGYAGGVGGLLSLRRGNIEAISPQSPEVLEGLRNGRYPSPFLNQVSLFWLPEAPDFLATGDFNADGYADVVAAARYGQTLYLFPGDGHGRLNPMTQVSLPGPVTAMTKGQFNERDGMSDLALGIIAPEGPAVFVFNESGKGVLGTAERFFLPEAATTLTLAKLDDDTAGDLAVGANNQLLIIHGRNQADTNASQENAIERFAFPYSISAIAAGDFLFDRESKSKLALLSSDGTVHLMTPGPLDLRPYTKEELEARHKQRIKFRRGEADAASLTALDASMVHRPGKGNAWLEAESRRIGAIPAGANLQALLTTTRDAGAPLDQLLVLDTTNNKLQLVDDNDKLSTLPVRESARAIDSMDLDGAPVAVLTMRLSVDGRPGMVVLQQNQSGPELLIPVAATFNVNSNLDAVDDNPGNGICHTATNTCTLRAAMMESSYFGGSNTINLLASTTYTLTLGSIFGGPDDEFDAAGDDQTGGDLDLIDLNRICAQLGPGICTPPTGVALTSVTIAGGNINTTIIAMGNLVPAAGAPNAGLNHDRVLDVNNFADPQFDINVQLSNLTIQSGNAPHYQTSTPGNFYHTPGGAIQYDGINNVSGNPLGTLTLTTCKITSNTADGQGGGIFAIDDTLIVQTSSLVTLNTSTLGSGGGISYSGGNKVTTQTLQILSSTIGGVAAANNAPDLTFGNGAGISSVGGSGATITSSTISNNTAGNQGGGVAFANTAGIAISSSTISSNTAKTHGGGIYSSARNAVTNAASTNTLTTTNVTGNTADSDNNSTGNGGGIYNFFGTLTVQTTSHIDSNTAVNGGGIFDTWTQNTNDLPASVVVNTSSTVGQTGSGNAAKNNGGGIAIDVGGNSVTTPKTGSVTLTSVTVQGNTANSDNAGGGDGGGIHDIGNDVNFMITCSLNGATIDSNVANAGGGGGTGDGVFLSSGTMSGVNTVSFNGGDTLNLNGGTFTSTSGTLNLTGNFTRATAGTFNHNSGTVNFNGSGAQTINGTATSDTFNNFIVNKSGGSALATGGSTTSLIMNDLTMTLGTFTAPATLDINGNTFLNGGTLTAGANITAAGNWTNNGGTFTPGSGLVTFDGAVAQSINGSAASQTFNNFAVNKGGASTLNTGGSTVSLIMNNLTMTLGTFTAPATLDINGNTLLTAGTLTAGANITAAGNWTNNGGTFTPGAGSVTFDTGTANNLNGTAVTQTFNNFVLNKSGGSLTGAGSTTTLTLNGSLTLTAGTFAAGTITAINLPGNWTNNGGTFTPGSSNVTFNSNAAPQSINGTAVTQTFFTITVNKTGQTLSTGGSTTALDLDGSLVLTAGTFPSPATLNIGGSFTEDTGFTFTPPPSITFDGSAAGNINGTLATKTFNDVVINKSNTLTGAGGTTALDINGNLTLTAGTLAAGTATTITVSGNWANTGTFTGGAGTVIFDGAGNTQTLSGTTTFNNLTINHTGAGNADASGSTLTVTGLLRVQGGTFISSSTFANVQIDSGQTLQGANGTTMNVSGNWTNNGGTFTPNGNTVNFNGSAAQIIGGTAASQTFNNFTVNKPVLTLSAGGSTTSITVNDLTLTAGSFTAPATLDINGNTLLTAGTLTAGTSITAAGSWTNNGATFTAGAGTVTLDGGAGQTIGGTTATTFNNLTNSDVGGIAMNNDNTVNGALALTSSDITVAATKTLTQPLAGSSSGTFDVNGRVQRNGFVSGGGALSFGNPLNTIQVTADAAPANIVVDLTRSVPTGTQGFPTAVQRTYTITPSAGGFTGTLRLRYLESELNGNVEGPDFIFRRFNGTGWAPVLPTSSDFTNNWLEATGVTQFSAWTFNSTVAPTATNGVVSGRIVDNNGVAVEGAVVRLTGTQNRKLITDANGFYRFDSVETNGFYTVTPSRANYTFSPASRSFSQIGQTTEATFGATVTSSTLVNPLDTPEYFVRQHYLDFLGREPDESGFNFWSDQILECGTDTSCVERRRINVSAAYFLSIEFQTTGGLVDGLYRASYGVRPQFAQFIPDTRAIAQGVVVGQEGWEAKLDANKQAFVAAFVNRPAFVAVYGNMDNSTYVDTLISHTGVAFTSIERDALVGGLANGTLTRSAVLQSIAENQRFINAKFNDAFVMMEYFGYLRRDADASGFAFWLNKLNEFGGNFEQAEMVKAFIVSDEYRDRFPR